MEIKFIIISLLIIIILALLFMTCNFKESFQDTSSIDFNDKFSSQKLINMFDSLEKDEKRCKKIENDLEIQQDIDNIKERETEYKELDELDKKLLELKEILKELTIEKTRKDNINNECKKDTQVKLNKNYHILNKLNDKKLIPSENMAIDLNVSDLLLNKTNISNSNSIKKESKCQTKDNKNYVKATNVKKKCHNCNIESIKKNLQHLNSDFKN